MFDKITWPVVTLIGLILAAVVTMALAGADTAVITNLVILLGLGGGLGVLAGIKSNVNGNLRELTRMVADAMDKLSQSPAIPSKEEE